MYLNNINLFTKNEKELETLIQIYSQDTGMELIIEKCTLLIMKSGNKQIPEIKVRTIGEKEI